VAGGEGELGQVSENPGRVDMMRKNRNRDKPGGGGGGYPKKEIKKLGAESWHVAEKLPAEPLMRSVGYNK
jgi:hypothetical protein